MKNNPLTLLIGAILMGLIISCSSKEETKKVVMKNDLAELELDDRGWVTKFCRRNGSSLLSQQHDAPFMSLRIGEKWHMVNALTTSGRGKEHQLHLSFEGTPVTARAVLRNHDEYFEVETVALEGDDSGAVGEWCFINLPVNPTASIGSWLNVVWDANFASAVIALEEKTNAQGAPHLQAVAYRSLGLLGRKAAIIACLPERMLQVVHDIETTQGLPLPTLGGQWAKTSREARKSWMITSLGSNDKRPAFTPERVFGTAKDLGVEYIVISLGNWQKSLGSYPVNTDFFPEGEASLKAVADQAHALGLKLGLHVMSTSVSKNDPYVTPVPDPRLYHDAEVTLSADVDAASTTLTTREPLTGFGLASGYWAHGGVDVQVDDEIIRYGGIADNSLALTNCVRGAYGTRATPHKAGARVRHITERWGWYVATPELAQEIGRNLAGLVNRAGLDMICFDGADVTAERETKFYQGHQVAQSLLRHAQRDVLLISNGITHFGWHCMTRGGEDDAMAFGYKRWVDDHTVHSWGATHRKNFLIPDFSWVGIFPNTPTMTVTRPDDVELVCTRSLGYDAPVGWGFAACYGGRSNVETFTRNGRKDEIAAIIRNYEKLRMENYFSGEALKPLCEQGSEWLLVPPGDGEKRYRLVPVRYLKSGIIQGGTSWHVQNDLGDQSLTVRVEALPALAAYGTADNVVVADFAKLELKAAGNPGANVIMQRTGQKHPQSGTVIRLSCDGPAQESDFPARLSRNGRAAWAYATATLPAKLDLSHHRALGLWIKGDGSGATLCIQVERTPTDYLHFYQVIDFTGWRYCELGEHEGERVMDYFTYDKQAMHDMKLDGFENITMAILSPPRGRNVEVELGRIEALREMGGKLINPRIRLGNSAIELPVTLEPGQYLETGDWWGTRDPSVCRVFDADGRELRRLRLDSLSVLPAGASTIYFGNEGTPSALAKVTVMLKGQ